MASVLYPAGDEEGAQAQSQRGLSGIFNRKKARPSSSVFEAEQQAEDAFDAFQAVPGDTSTAGHVSLPHAHGPLPGNHKSHPAGASHAAAELAAARAAVAAAEEEAGRLREQCEQQASQLAAAQEGVRRSRAAEREVRGAFNLQRFKYELLLDLWCMRVLDYEELGMQANTAVTAAASPRGRQ